jgi:hypothetical protein
MLLYRLSDLEALVASGRAVTEALIASAAQPSPD